MQWPRWNHATNSPGRICLGSRWIDSDRCLAASLTNGEIARVCGCVATGFEKKNSRHNVTRCHKWCSKSPHPGINVEAAWIGTANKNDRFYNSGSQLPTCSNSCSEVAWPDNATGPPWPMTFGPKTGRWLWDVLGWLNQNLWNTLKQPKTPYLGGLFTSKNHQKSQRSWCSPSEIIWGRIGTFWRAEVMATSRSEPDVWQRVV